jgi:hypothetical protein
VNFRPSHMTVAELESGFRQLAALIYSEEATQERRERFRTNYRAKRFQEVA